MNLFIDLAIPKKSAKIVTSFQTSVHSGDGMVTCHFWHVSEQVAYKAIGY